MDVAQEPKCPEPSMFTSDYEKVLTMEKSATNLKLVLEQLVRKYITADTDETCSD